MRSNGFDGLRLLAAAMVIYGHAYPLTGAVGPGLLGSGIHTIGVKIFFVISGFLIATSWQADPSVPRYLCKRALRIMPGLVSVCLLTVLVLGPVFTRIPAGTFFTTPQTWDYFWNIALRPVYALPGVFEGNTYPRAVNGSLWTLPVEVLMYLGVPFVVARSRALTRYCLPLIAVLLLVLSIYVVRIAPPKQPWIVWGTSLVSVLELAFYFYAGASIAVFRLGSRVSAFVPCCALILAAVTIRQSVWDELALALLLPWCTIALGIRSFGALSALKDRDYSYGIYLCGFPIQQILVDVLGPHSALLNAFLAFFLSFALAIFSWHFIEKPALSLKPSGSRAVSSSPA